MSPPRILSICVALLLPCGFVTAQKRDAGPAPAVRTYVLAPRGDLVFAGQTGGMMVRDMADPTRPVDVAWLPLPSAVYDIVIDGDLALLAAGSRGLVVVDIEQADAPVELARLNTDGKVKRVAWNGSHAFLADGVGGLITVDVTSLADPRVVSRISTRGDVRAVALQGDRLAIAESHGGARVFDVKRPDNPREITRLSTDFGARDVCWIGDRLYVAAGSEGTAFYDPGSSSRPLGFLPPSRSAQHVACEASQVAVSNMGSTIQLFDVAAAGAPRERARTKVHRSSPTGRSRFDGTRLWVAVDAAGMGLLDLADPANPERVLPRRREFKVSY